MKPALLPAGPLAALSLFTALASATFAADAQQLHESHAISSRCGRAMKPRMVLPFRISVELRS